MLAKLADITINEVKVNLTLPTSRKVNAALTTLQLQTTWYLLPSDSRCEQCFDTRQLYQDKVDAMQC